MPLDDFDMVFIEVLIILKLLGFANIYFKWIVLFDYDTVYVSNIYEWL